MPERDPTIAMHNRQGGHLDDCSRLEDLRDERVDNIHMLLKRSERAGWELLGRAALILLVDAILLASLTWLLAGSPRLVGEGNLVIRLVFSLAAVFAAVLLAISIALTFRSLFFLHREKGSALLDFEAGSPIYVDADTFRREFGRTSRANFLEQMVDQVRVNAVNRRKLDRLFRWGGLFLLMALFPYLVAIIFEVFLLFL